MREAGRGDSGTGRLSLDELIALNDEIAALARSGLPLELGLLEMGRDVSGRMGRLAVSLGKRMSQGESLTAALAAERTTIPPLYRAVVEAGVRSGRLASALEGVAGYARGYADSRRSIGLALWYPGLVLMLAFALFTFLVTQLIPVFLAAFESLHLSPHGLLVVLARVGDLAWYWAPAVLVLFVAAGAWWIRSGQSVSLRPGRSGSPLRWFPWVGSILSSFEAANFAELLALLLDHRVPLPEAVVLCASATDDPAVMRAGKAFSAALEQGTSPDDALRERSTFPPLLRWVLATGTRQGDLIGALRQLASLYRRQAQRQAEKLRVLLPILMIFTLGAAVTLLYGLTLFLPYTSLLKQLSWA